MRQGIAGMAAGLLMLGTASAQAASWAWGCQGQLTAPDQSVIFTRYQMVVLDGKRPPMPPDRLLGDAALNPLINGDSAGYDPNNINDGLVNTIIFTRDAAPKATITLTELSSRRLSHKAKVICGRDEVTDTFRKVYRYERDNETPRTLTMQCIEYTLSTRGGRKGCD